MDEARETDELGWSRGASGELAEQWLTEAHDLVLAGWCQRREAEDDRGEAIEPASAFARRWSAQGALRRLLRRSAEDECVALDAYVLANLALTAAVRSTPEAWNDAPARRVEEVLEGLRAAVPLVSGLPSRPAQIGTPRALRAVPAI